MKKDAAKIWKEKDFQSSVNQKYISNQPLSKEQREFYEFLYPFMKSLRPNLNERWDIYEYRDPYKRKALQIPLTAKGSKDNDYFDKVSDIIRKDFVDSRIHDYKNKYKEKLEDFSAPFVYDPEYDFNLEDVKKCDECGELVTAYDEIRSERFCSGCGLVEEQFMPEMIQHKAYKGPVDEDNLGRNGDYGQAYTKKNWKKPRNNQDRPHYTSKKQDRYDRLMDTLIEDSPVAWYNYENKILKPILKKEGYGSKSLGWWELRRRRPPSKKKDETEEERTERQKAERDKKRIHRLNNRLMVADLYINENGLPRWVRQELKHILKQIPKKVTMTEIHSRLNSDKIIVGIVLYIMHRAGELNHPISKNTSDLTPKELDIIFENLDKILERCKALYDDSRTY
jgi:hypothetical protein